MTNLLEKALLLGFSIFLLTVFSVIITPFLNEFIEYNEIEKSELEIYTDFLDEIDKAVVTVIKNPYKSYLQEIEYPNNLNLTFLNVYIISDFLIGNNLYSKTLSYNTSFHSSYFHNFPPQKYVLNVSYLISKIFVNFLNLY